MCVSALFLCNLLKKRSRELLGFKRNHSFFAKNVSFLLQIREKHLKTPKKLKELLAFSSKGQATRNAQMIF